MQAHLKPTKSRNLNSFIITSIPWSWENYFRESTWPFGYRSWTFQYSTTSNPTYRWKHWGRPLVSANDTHSVTIWPWVYKDIFHFIVSIITPKRFPISNKWTKYPFWITNTGFPKTLAKFWLSVSQFIFRTKSLTLRKSSPEKSINLYHLTIYTQAQAHTCTHIAIASTKDYASEEKEWTHSLPHLMIQTQVHCSWRIKI